jgi:Bacterial Ig-like domain (group 2)
MSGRFCVRALLLVSLVLPFAGCGSSTEVDSITVSPATVSLAIGGTTQLTATASIGHGSHPASSQNITATATWISSTPKVATVSAGVVTAVGAGSATITATMQGFGGLITSNEITVTVTGTSGGSGTSSLISVTVVPGDQAVSSPSQTSQFIAIGTTSTGATVDVTSQVGWNSSSIQVAKISATGLATGLSKGTTTITALASNADGTTVVGTATFTVTNGAAEPFTAISVSPGSESLSATGQTGQFVALGTSGSTGLQQDVTNSTQVSWSSSIPTIATVTTSPAVSAGTVAGVSPGTTQITAKLTNPDGTVLTSSANITVTASAAAEPLLSITVLPNTITLGNLQGTAQYLAYGTFSTPPTVMDITNGIDRSDFKSAVTWVSGLQTYFPITSSGYPNNPPNGTETDGGLITAYANGTADVYAVATNPDGTVVYSPAATFNCPLVLESVNPTTGAVTPGSCNPDTIANPLLVTLTVFNAGLDQTDWLIEADSATGTANVIHCGPGAAAAGFSTSVCSAPYPINTPLTIRASSPSGQFGGWSYNCTPVGTVTAAGPNSCTITVGDVVNGGVNSSATVGAIFNLAPTY